MVRTASIAILFIFFCLVARAQQQVQISGTVYERTARIGLSGVSVRTTNSGVGSVTDSNGHYTIKVPVTDSLYFSYQGKATQKFAVNEINPYRAFDTKLHVDIQTLPTFEIITKPKTYKYDSIENRREYQKYFDFSPEWLTSGNGGAGVNLDALFSIGKIKRAQNFRKLLLRDEQEKYVDYRWNRPLVARITGMQSPALDGFMREYRPTYAMLMSFENEYDYLRYIKEMGDYYADWWNRNHFDQPARKQ